MTKGNIDDSVLDTKAPHDVHNEDNAKVAVGLPLVIVIAEGKNTKDDSHNVADLAVLGKIMS